MHTSAQLCYALHMRVTVSLPDDVVAAVQARADAADRSLSNMFGVLVKAGLAAPQITHSVTTVATGGKVFRGADPKGGK